MYFVLTKGVPDECSRWLNLEPPLITYALHEQNLMMVKEELARCQQNHQHPTRNQENFLPTRLIDVGSDEHAFPPRLVVTDTIMRTGAVQYAALSYCWGPPSDAKTQLKTEKSTLKDRLIGFSLDEVTPAVRDAIIVTRALAIPFLWVDALCIVQDDKPDWEVESYAMTDIYQKALITICTPGSNSCRKGFLQRRPKSITIPFKSTICPTVQGLFNLRLGGLAVVQPQEQDDFDMTYLESEFSTSWAKRAWTFQEDVLSTRQLLFGSYHLTFLCPENSKTEFRSLQIVGYGRLAVGHDLAFDSRRLELWEDLIENYIARDLTFESDRLPAISGIARIMGYSPENYFAGLWKESLETQLCWHRGMGSTSESKDAILRARRESWSHPIPSWSWATRKQSVAFWPVLEDDCRKEVHWIKASTTVPGSNPYGQITDSSLQIRGRLLVLPQKLVEDISSDGRFVAPSRRWSVFYRNRRIAWVNLDWEIKGTDEEGEGLFMLLLYSLPQLPPTNGIREGYGLILHPGKISGEYFRVGVFEANQHGLSRFARLEYQIINLI